MKLLSSPFFLAGVGLLVVGMMASMPYGLGGISFYPYAGMLLGILGAGTMSLGLLEDQIQERVLATALDRLPHAFLHTFFTIIFLANVVLLVVFMLFPDRVVSGDASLVRDVQVLGCVGTAGLMGGFIREIHTRLHPSSSIFLAEGESVYARFWESLFALFTAFFTSVVLFWLLRAGILRTVEIDTFNVYGVTGVAAVTGYFAGNIVTRFRGLYQELVGT